MRPITIVFLVFAAGIFLGHEYWPQSHPDPAFHFRFHRGRLPNIPTGGQDDGKTNTVKHGRILSLPTPATNN